jgi:C4-dicarboxylate-specific signal transduction histidine kinase
VISDVIAIVGDLARSHSIELRQETVDRLAPVIADKVQLQQVLLNLVINGIESIVGGQARRRVLSITASQSPAGELTVCVHDSGPGLAPAEHDKVFEAFYTSKVEGLGMGLAISRSIIEAHGGRLYVAPVSPGNGAKFCFCLPTDHSALSCVPQ